MIYNGIERYIRGLWDWGDLYMYKCKPINNKKKYVEYTYQLTFGLRGTTVVWLTLFNRHTLGVELTLILL